MEKLNDMDRKYNNLFERYNKHSEINEELKEEIINIKNELNKTLPNELISIIILHGIPYEVNETVKDKLKKIENQLQIPLEDHQFTAIRLGKQDKKATLIKIIFKNEEIEKSLIASP
ncbi:hypothetical protein HHI36_000379 [Cryptolaemus montrouzieri]|uniref:Uncharacterized protein n=1 Tax=Cryptolaemus montrouzieri TaxID=559131 RepID=A0ABD2P4G5_9CUCU